MYGGDAHLTMRKRKSKFDLAAERATLILQEHFDSLPPKVAKRKRAAFGRLTSKMARGSRRTFSLDFR